MATAERINFSSGAPQATSPALVLKKGGAADGLPRTDLFSSKKSKKNAPVLSKDAPRLQDATPKILPSNFQALIMLMQAIVTLMVNRAQNDGKQSQMQTQVANQMTNATQQASQNALDEIQKAEAAQASAQKVAFWQKLAGWTLTVVSIAVVFVTAGPMAAFILGAVMISDQLGAFNGLNNIGNPWVRFGVKMGIVLGASLGAGCLAAGGDMVLATAVRSSASVAADGSAAAAEQSSASVFKNGVSMGMQVGTQQFMAMNPLQDFFTGIINPNNSQDQGKQKLINWLTTGISALLALASAGVLSKIGMGSSQTLESIESAAKNSSSWASVQKGITFMRNPWVTNGASFGASLMSGGAGIAKGVFTLQQASALQRLGPAMASLSLLQASSSILQNWIKQLEADSQARSQAFQMDIGLWASFAEPWKTAAQVV